MRAEARNMDRPLLRRRPLVFVSRILNRMRRRSIAPPPPRPPAPGIGEEGRTDERATSATPQIWPQTSRPQCRRAARPRPHHREETCARTSQPPLPPSGSAATGQRLRWFLSTGTKTLHTTWSATQRALQWRRVNYSVGPSAISINCPLSNDFHHITGARAPPHFLPLLISG